VTVLLCGRSGHFAADADAEARFPGRSSGPLPQRRRHETADRSCRRRSWVSGPSSRRPIGCRETRPQRDGTKPAVRRCALGMRVYTIVSGRSRRAAAPAWPRPTLQRPSEDRFSPSIVQDLPVVAVSAVPTRGLSYRAFPVARTLHLFAL